MKKILIINTTRMGDLIQSTPLIGALRNKYPDGWFTLVVSSDFEQFAPRIPYIDEILVINLRQFNIKNSQGKLKSWVEVYRYLEEFLCSIKNKKYDGIFNLSHSKLSALMLAYLKVSNVWGFSCNDTGDRMTFHPWMQYFGIEPYNRIFNTFNLADIYLRASDMEHTNNKLAIKTEPNDLVAAEELLRSGGIFDGDNLIAFQAGSSLSGRRWSAASFARLGDLLCQKFKAKIALLGVESEEEVAKEIISRMKSKNRVINLTGKTGFTELIGILRRSSYLVTNDTGTMHLAAALRVPIVGLFFAHAHPIETSPYGEGHIIFQARISCAPCSYGVVCNDIACVKKVDPEDVFRFMSEHFEHGKWSTPACLKASSELNVYLTKFDSSKYLEMYPLIKRVITFHDIIRFAYNLMWRDSLNFNKNLDYDDVSDLAQVTKIFENRYDLFDVQIIIDTTNSKMELFRQLAKWAADGVRVATQIRRGMKKGFRQQEELDKFAIEISGLDEQINRLGMSNFEVKPITDIFNKRKENLCGDDVTILASETINCYSKLEYESSRMFFVLEKLCKSFNEKELVCSR